MRILILLGILSSAALAQYPTSANALYWNGATSQAGLFCWGFSCTPAVATVTAGETGTLLIRAGFPQSHYILAFSATATRCLSIPSFAANSLVLDDPIVVWPMGICDEWSPILACPNWMDTLTFAVPLGIPSGFEVSVQAITAIPAFYGPPGWSFTQAITFRVL